MESLGSKISRFLLKRMYFKKQMQLSGEEYWENVKKNRFTKPGVLKPLVFRNICLETIEYEPYALYRAYPIKDDAEKLILFIHGGSFVSTILPFHFNFIYDIMSGTKTQAIIPLYPLLPEGEVEDIHERLLEVYLSVVESGINPDNIVVMGDSAGGYLSLILCHLLRQYKLPMPGRLILISPLLDFCKPTESAKELEEKDPFLATACRGDLFEKLSNGREIEDPLVSPRFGDFSNFPQIDIFTGTDDILYLQAKAFSEDKLCSEKVVLHTYKNMIHNFPILPIPEGIKARNEIISTINKDFS